MANDIMITVKTALALFGAIAIIGGGVSVVAKMFSPFKKLKETVDAHDKKLKDGCLRMDNIDDSMHLVEESNKVICKSLLVLLNHEVTGNGIDKLKEQRDTLEQFLIDK